MPATSGALLDRTRAQARVLREMYRRGAQRRQWMRERHTQSPPLRRALVEDARMTLRFRGEERPGMSRTELAAEMIRLTFTSDAFLAQVLYRGRVAALRRGIPVIPRLCHVGSMTLSQVCIGDPVIVDAGLYLPHGQVVVDGITRIGPEVILFPWTTVGLRAGNFTGPSVGPQVHVGTGAKIVGPVSVGGGARLGANTVIVTDVPGGATVVGVPGRVAGAARL